MALPYIPGPSPIFQPYAPYSNDTPLPPRTNTLQPTQPIAPTDPFLSYGPTLAYGPTTGTTPQQPPASGVPPTPYPNWPIPPYTNTPPTQPVVRGGPTTGRPAHGGTPYIQPQPSNPFANLGGNYRQFGGNPWHNMVNFAPQNWSPEWFRTEHDTNKRQEAQRRFRNDLSQGDEIAMQEWETYLANKAMGFLNPRDAQAVGMGLNVLGNDQGTYDTQSFGLNPVFGMQPGASADVMYGQANKWDAFMNNYGTAKNDLIGAGVEQDFANDGTLDPFESMDRFVQSASQIGKNFGLGPVARNNQTGAWVDPSGNRPGKSRLNRWEEQDLAEQWGNLASTSGINPSSPLYRAVQSMVMPTKYKPPASTSAFRVSNQPSTQPQYRRSGF